MLYGKMNLFSTETIAGGDEKGPGGNDSAYVDNNSDNQPDKDSQTGYYLVDLKGDRWFSRITNHAISQGLRGIVINDTEVQTYEQETFINRIKEVLPEITFIQRGNVSQLKDRLEWLSGVLIENSLFKNNGTTPPEDTQLKQLVDEIRTQDPEKKLVIFSMDKVPPQSLNAHKEFLIAARKQGITPVLIPLK